MERAELCDGVGGRPCESVQVCATGCRVEYPWRRVVVERRGRVQQLGREGGRGASGQEGRERLCHNVGAASALWLPVPLPLPLPAFLSMLRSDGSHGNRRCRPVTVRTWPHMGAAPRPGEDGET